MTCPSKGLAAEDGDGTDGGDLDRDRDDADHEPHHALSAPDGVLDLLG